MKYLAHLENSLNSEIISVYDVIKGQNGDNPQQWEGREYYSLWYRTPMSARVKSKEIKPHFSFKQGYGGNKNSGGGESIEHQLSKKIIYDLKCLHLTIGEIEGYLRFSEVIIEKPFNNREYIADLYCKIADENNFGLPVNSMIVIELMYTSTTKRTKIAFYRRNNIAAIEIKIWNDIKYNDDIIKLQNRLEAYFKKMKYAKRLHDPNWQNLKVKKNEKVIESIYDDSLSEVTSKVVNYFEEIKGENDTILDVGRKQEQLDSTMSNSENIKHIAIPIIQEKKKRKSFWDRILKIFFKKEN